MKSVALLASLLLLIACVPEEDPGDTPPVLSPEAVAACAADGGTIGIAGLSGGEICVRPTPDAGRACTRSSDCASYCEAISRTCAPNDYPFGCYSYLDEDGEAVTICVD